MQLCAPRVSKNQKRWAFEKSTTTHGRESALIDANLLSKCFFVSDTP
jgi:hypothetical protein